MPFITIALLIAAALGGGASVAAQNSLPGDALWGFKVGVNENIQAALAADGKAQADFDIGAIETRMKEAATLSSEARLTADVRADIESNFDAHVKSVQEQVAKLEAKGDYSAAADVAARFQATIASNASVLSDAGAKTESSAEASAEVKASVRSSLEGLMLKVRGTLDSASALSAEASAKAAANADTGTTASTSNSGSGAGTSGGAAGTVETGARGTGGIQVDADAGAQIAI